MTPVREPSIWYTLSSDALTWIDRVARERFELAVTEGDDTEGRSEETRWRDWRNGYRGEAATRMFVGPTVHWAITESVHPPKPDFAHFIDVKVRRLTHHRLMIDRKYFKPDHAYLLVCCADHPHYRIVGWCWGHEAATPDRWEEQRKGAPAWWVKADDPIMKSPNVLREMALATVLKKA